MGWVIAFVIVVVLVSTFSILKIGSDTDDIMLGDAQYEEES